MRVCIFSALLLLALVLPPARAQRGVVPIKKTTPRPAAKATPAPTPRPTPRPVAKKTTKPAPRPPKAVVVKRPAKKVETKQSTAGPPAPPVEAASYSVVNSLGMRFVRMGELEVCIWPVRVGDFAAFQQATARDPLPQTSFAQTSDHPVVNVTWKDAVHFCEWLTETERASGRLAADREYRLPTDTEWSMFAGLGEEPGATPEERDLSTPDVYPWGLKWPPPPGAGNFADDDSGLDVRIPGYKDGFSQTAPVGSFAPSSAGLFDVSGNVLQWCRDAWNPKSRERVLRGSSWFNGGVPVSLLASARVRAGVERAGDSIGFRVVIGRAGAR